MKKIILIPIVIIYILVTSCGNKLKTYTTSSTGRNGEILVVAEKNLWKGELKDTITNYFTSEQYGLPQPEPKFTIFSIPNDEFNRILRPHRSILMIEIDPSVKEGKVEVKKDHWASPQVILNLTGPNRESIISKFWELRETMSDYFINSEYLRYQKTGEQMEDVIITKTLKEQYKSSMIFPKGYSISKSLENFCWIRKEAKDFSHGVLFYSFNYTDKKQLEQKTILHIRDTTTKAHIPGPTDSSYMVISRQLYLPVSKEIKFNNMYCIETRGLWRVENDFMGGPFVNYTFVDEKNKRIIVLDGYVYAPRDNKRDMLRSVEAILHSWKPNSETASK